MRGESTAAGSGRHGRLKLDHSTGEVPPVLFQSGAEGYWRCWVGTREQLIEAGLCTEAQFPEGKKKVKDCFEGETRYSVRRKAGGLFEFMVWPSQAERDAMQEAEQERMMVLHNPRQYRAFLQQALVDSPYRFLERAALQPTKRSPFKLTADDFNEIRDRLSEINDILVDALIEDYRPKGVDPAALSAARHDGVLQHFLNRIQGKELL